MFSLIDFISHLYIYNYRKYSIALVREPTLMMIENNMKLISWIKPQLAIVTVINICCFNFYYFMFFNCIVIETGCSLTLFFVLIIFMRKIKLQKFLHLKIILFLHSIVHEY